jgi:hypothetical protein
LRHSKWIAQLIDLFRQTSIELTAAAANIAHMVRGFANLWDCATGLDASARG